MSEKSIKTYFQQDHNRLDGLLKRFLDLKRTDFPKAEEYFKEYRFGLMRHLLWEEEILFPLFEKKARISWGPTQVMRMEHLQIRDHLEAINKKIQEQDLESDQEEQKLLSVLSGHQQKEEHILYPAIDRLLSEAERESVFSAMKSIPIVKPEGKRLSKRLIRQRLVLHILLAGFLPLALGSGLIYYYSIQALRSSIGANFQEIAIETGKRIATLISNEVQKLRNLATVPVIVVGEVTQANRVYTGQSEEAVRQRLQRLDREWVQARELSSADRDLLATESSRYLRRIVELDDRKVIGILITDRYGGLVAASTSPKRFYFGEEPWWQAAMQRENVYVSGVVSPDMGSFDMPEETLDIAIPIRNHSDSRVLGVAKISYGFSNLVAAIFEVRLGRTGHAMLFDSGGTPLICPILPRNQHLVDSVLLSKILSPTPGWTIAPDDAHGAHNTIVSYAPVPMINGLRSPNLDGKSWHIFIRQHPDESYAPAYALLKKVVILGGLLVGLLALSGFYVGSRISRPIRELQRGAKLIGEGELDHRLIIQTKDELEELAREFNKMTEKIKISQEDLRNFSGVVYHTADAILITYVDGTIFYVNPAFAKLTGYSEEEVIGQTPRILKSGRNDPKIYQEMWSTVLSGKVWRGELINKKKDGTLFHSEVTVAPILDKTGKVVNFLGMEKDITERKRLEEAREHWNRELELKVEERTAQVLHAEKLASIGRMAAGMAHEIGNPLSSISAIVQILEAGKAAKEEQASYLCSLKQLVNRIDRTLRGLLTFSRPSLPKLEPLDLNQVIEEAIGITAPDARFKKIVVDQKLACDLPKTQGDHDQLVQVFVNLLLNAADAVSTDGRITIQTRHDQENEGAVILFSDNGHGITPEALSKIFDPFYTTKPPGKGTGLGLSICRSIIEGMRGKIEVESQVGKGTTFALTLPASAKTEPQRQALIRTH